MFESKGMRYKCWAKRSHKDPFGKDMWVRTMPQGPITLIHLESTSLCMCGVCTAGGRGRCCGSGRPLMQRSETEVVYLPLLHSTLLFEKGSLTWSSNHPFSTICWPVSPQDLLVSASPDPSLGVAEATPDLLHKF